MSESKTPRTDAVVKPFIGSETVSPTEASALLDFARTLELELNEAKKELDRKEHGSNGWQWRKAIMGLLVELGIEKLNWGESFTYGWGGPFEFIKGTFAERDELCSQLTTAQQEIAELRKELSRWKP